MSKYNYSWLKNAGFVGMIAMLIMLIANLKIDGSISSGYIRISKLVSYTVQILGTWVFSSVSCLMDITSHVKDGKKGFKFIVLATFLTNILLIVLGYVINIAMETFVSLSILNLLAILISIWTTNDSNFYSTTCSLKEIGISKRYSLLMIPLLSSMVSIFVVKDSESHLVQWLSLMSWIGIPIGFMWWSFYFKE